jgi:hypothetical protein
MGVKLNAQVMVDLQVKVRSTGKKQLV